MNPNDVNEMLKTLIQEQALPITAYNGKVLLIVEGEYLYNTSERYVELERCLETIIKQWKGDRTLEDFKNRRSDGTWYATILESFSEIHNKIESVSLDAPRVSEAREVLQSLIEERTLPVNIIEQCKVVILPDKPIEYRTEEMIELDDLLQEMALEGSLEEDIKNVHVRHNGFSFHPKKGTPDIDFSKVQALTHYLQSEIIAHGLHVKLLHEGFALKTDNEIELDRSEYEKRSHRLMTESEEIAYRLTIMTGIDFRKSGFQVGGGFGVHTTYLRADRAYPY